MKEYVYKEPNFYSHAPLYRMGGELRLTSQFMYGSSRLGSVECNQRIAEKYYYAVTPNFNVETGLRLDGSLVEGGMPQNVPALPAITYDYTNRKVGTKHYELTNHLGSVMSVITDRKLSKGTENPNDINNWLAGTEYYVPEVVQYTDYSPFGVELEGRKGTANERGKHGFQGQLLDDDIKGEGNSVNYKYRMYDPRLGRFSSVDPLTAKYPHNSSYAFSENCVINAVELEGLEKVYVYNYAYDSKTKSKVITLSHTEVNKYLDENINRIDYYGPNGKVTKQEYKSIDLGQKTGIMRKPGEEYADEFKNVDNRPSGAVSTSLNNMGSYGELEGNRGIYQTADNMDDIGGYLEKTKVGKPIGSTLQIVADGLKTYADFNTKSTDKAINNLIIRLTFNALDYGGGKIIDKSKKLSETEKHTTDAILGENVNHFKDKALESNK